MWGATIWPYAHPGTLSGTLSDVLCLLSMWPQFILIWSDIVARRKWRNARSVERVPRVVWQGARDLGAVERVRRSVNSRLAHFVRHRGGLVVQH